MPPDEPPEMQALRLATEGLLYPSESDEPFDVFHWIGKGTTRRLLRSHVAKLTRISEIKLSDFFAALESSDDAARYRQLRSALESHLTGLRVFRAGTIRVDVYVLGKTRTGDWLGLHTVSVET